MARQNRIGVRKTRRSVIIIDKIADKVITVGGILVIAAVFGMMVFLVSQVIPLFQGGEVLTHQTYTLQTPRAAIASLLIDEFKTVAVRIDNQGKLEAWSPQTGTPIKVGSFDFGGKKVTASSQSPDGAHIAFGFEDGAARLGSVIVKTEILKLDDLPKGLKKIDERDSSDGTVIYSLIPGNQIRKSWVELGLEDEIKIAQSGSPIVAMDYRYSKFGERPKKMLAVMDKDSVGHVLQVESQLNLFTRKVTSEVTEVSFPPLPRGTPIVHVLVNELADTVYFAEKSGKVYRFNTRNMEKPFLAETARLTPEGVDLDTLGYLLGEGSIVAGGSDGSVNIYFLLRGKDRNSNDGYGLVRSREFDPQPDPIVAFAPSVRDRAFATSDAAGRIWIRHGTSVRTLVETKLKGDPKQFLTTKIAFSPREDGLLAVSEDGKTDFWNLDIPHPETSLYTLFGKVWYEGYPEPSYTWQSTGATDAFEPKLSIVPLIFGTLKATFYSLLFAVPLALLAAIYTSEFLSPSVRGKIKPVIEIMASIPSVVLGFIAALVLAPIVENWIAAVILAIVVVPTSLIFAAYLWQLLPPPLAVRLEGVPKLVTIFLIVLLALYLGYSLGPIFEWLFFGGNFKAWVRGDMGSGTPFLFLIFLPISAIMVSMMIASLFGLKFNNYMKSVAPFTAASMDLLRWLGIALASIALSFLAAELVSALGFDPRGGFVDTYVQRNTLIVGFAMGFAVIPIIYTLSEDALNAVPEHLRAASLGCGATPWQTAIWVILPTAVSGVFSATMIGMGRAVGETMIVVMSAGNTPLIDLNIFNGLRALSANIAVELPEAPKDGTLYRVLFLTGLVLFAMTFAINTLAEMVRIRFRKKSLQL